MDRNAAIAALKGAIIMEYQAKELYASVFTISQHLGIKQLFIYLRDEEKRHIKILRSFLSKVTRGEDPQFDIRDQSLDHFAKEVLTQQIVKGVSGAGYDAAMISVALQLEKQAVLFYQAKADEAATQGMKGLFTWLVNWEKDHMLFLSNLDRELREKIWFEKEFWPQD